MAINQKIIHFTSKKVFEGPSGIQIYSDNNQTTKRNPQPIKTKDENIIGKYRYGNIPWSCLAIIDDTGEMWTRGKYLNKNTWSDITDKPTFAKVATSGSYDDLTDKPSIPSKDSWNYDDVYLKLTGGTVTGPITINSSVNNNYNEGLRISRAGNNWAGITFGSSGTSGAPTDGWVAATNPSKQFIISPDTSSNTIGLTLNKGGDALWRNNTIYHSGNLSPMTTSHAANAITSTNITNWNTAYNWYNTITTADTDKAINKWDEVIRFLSTVEDDTNKSITLNSIMNGYLPVTGANYNTNTNTNLFKISRTGGNNECLTIGVDDSRVYFNFLQDENICTYRFTGTWDGSENPSTYGSGSHYIDFNLGASGPSIYIEGNCVYHTGNLPAYPTKNSWNYDDVYLKLSGGTVTGDTTFTGGKNFFKGSSTGSSTISADLDTIVIGCKQTRSSNANTYYSGLAFNHMMDWDANKTYQNSPQAWIGIRLQDTPGSERSHLVFATKNLTTASNRPEERMCITPDGDVGINTKSPITKLQVNGSLQIGEIAAIGPSSSLKIRQSTDDFIGLTLTGNRTWSFNLHGGNFSIRDWDGNTNRITISKTDGTTSIVGGLSVSGTAYTSDYIMAGNGNIYVGATSGSRCHLQMDTTNKCLNFIFD